MAPSQLRQPPPPPPPFFPGLEASAWRPLNPSSAALTGQLGKPGACHAAAEPLCFALRLAEAQDTAHHALSLLADKSGVQGLLPRPTTTNSCSTSCGSCHHGLQYAQQAYCRSSGQRPSQQPCRQQQHRSGKLHAKNGCVGLLSKSKPACNVLQALTSAVNADACAEHSTGSGSLDGRTGSSKIAARKSRASVRLDVPPAPEKRTMGGQLSSLKALLAARKQRANELQGAPLCLAVVPRGLSVESPVRTDLPSALRSTRCASCAAKRPCQKAACWQAARCAAVLASETQALSGRAL